MRRLGYLLSQVRCYLLYSLSLIIHLPPVRGNRARLEARRHINNAVIRNAVRLVYSSNYVH